MSLFKIYNWKDIADYFRDSRLILGIGANFRLLLYAENNEFDGLNLNGSFALNDLKKWHNLLGEVLRI